ncbi:ABC transporter permease [Tomitella cavernea]|uniref:FtsX-like permease family protein n=1 Tax=Tomitella cavernea TaxID=1387982 RepID=A0ABP9CSQ7_9ACTN|nr:ABC transporter permease [Tomitella cavernea]
MTPARARAGGGRDPALRRVALRTLAANRVRLALTVIAVVLGTAFVAGSFVFTDTLHKAFDGVFADVAEGVDVQVSTEHPGAGGVPDSYGPLLRGLPHVAEVTPQISGPLVLVDARGRPVQTGGAPSMGLSYTPPGKAPGDPEPIVAGAPPSADGEVMLNDGAARAAGLHVGDRTQVLVPAKGLQDVTVTGIYAPAADTGGYVGIEFTAEQARALFTDGSHVGAFQVAATPGTAPATLRDEVAAALPDTPEMRVETGAQVRERVQSQLDDALRFVNYFLLAFGAIALLAGTFIIYNTFSMIVAQRMRELALLRAVGAGRRQIRRSVLGEAAAVGLAGSAVGLAAGIGLAYGLRAALNAADLGLPRGDLAVTARTVVAALALGAFVTVASAWVPARRASAVPPVAAMRAEFASTGTSLRRRTAVGALGIAGGTVALLLGATAETTPVAASVVGAGAATVLVGALLVSPALSSPVIRILGAAVPRVFGAPGRLAVTNATRNPRRTSATGFALTLGLMLVTLIGVFGASARSSVDALIDTGIRADFVLTGIGPSGIPPRAADAAAAAPGVGEVVRFHPVRAELDGASTAGLAASGPVADLLRLDIVSGNSELTGDGMLVSTDAAARHGWTVGDAVELTGPDGTVFRNVVRGTYAPQSALGDWVVGESAYHALAPALARRDVLMLVDAAPGVTPAALRESLTAATDPYLVVQVQDRDEFRGAQARQIDQMLAVLYGLLSLAIVIAVLGIVNTLALSVVERRREIGMLRVIGTHRAQVRRTVYIESTLIAVYGAVVGVVLGIAFGAAFVHALRNEGIDRLAIPWVQSLAMLAGAAAVGVAAAVWPASRASRTDPLTAIDEP